MRTSRFSPQEIAAALTRLDEGMSVRELSLEMSVSEPTIYKWKREFAGLPATGIDNSRQLKRENARLRQTVYLQRLELEVLRSQVEPRRKSAFDSPMFSRGMDGLNLNHAQKAGSDDPSRRR